MHIFPYLLYLLRAALRRDYFPTISITRDQSVLTEISVFNPLESTIELTLKCYDLDSPEGQRGHLQSPTTARIAPFDPTGKMCLLALLRVADVAIEEQHECQLVHLTSPWNIEKPLKVSAHITVCEPASDDFSSAIVHLQVSQREQS